MNLEQRNKIIREFFENRCISILESKGKASASGSEDANKNFKDGALAEKGIDSVDVWWIYFYKHIARLRNYIVTREKAGEDLEETLADIVNYACILLTLIEDKKCKHEKKGK